MMFGRKNICIVFICLTMLVLTLTPAIASPQPLSEPNQLVQIDDEDVFVIGIDIPYPPSQDLEGNARVAALGIELMTRIADDLDLNVEWVSVPTDGIFTALEAGEFDAVISSLPISETFEDIAVFSEPYFTERHGLFIRYPVMTAIANDFQLAVAREVDFTLFEAIHALSLTLVDGDEEAIAEAKDTLAPLLQNLGISALSLDNARLLVDSIAETEYVTAPEAMVEPLIHTNQLGGKRIGLLPNSVDEAYIMVEAPEAEIVAYETLEEAFAALEQGEVDGVFAPTWAGKAVVNASTDSTAILVNRRTLMIQNEFGFALSIDPDNPNNADVLIEMINDAAENLIINGTTVGLIETWAAIPSPGSMLRIALESMFSNNFPQLYQVTCEVITYHEEMASPEDIQKLGTATFDFSGLRFDTQVNRNGTAAQVTIHGTYRVTVDDATDEYDATQMFDEDIPIDMVYDGDNWLFCPEVG